MEDKGAYPAKGELVLLKASEVPFDGGKMDRAAGWTGRLGPACGRF